MGLSSPSVTDSTTTLARSPRSKSAGQTRFPTFSMKTMPPSGPSACSARCPPRSASRWQPAPVLIWMAAAPRRADPRRVVLGLLVALDHGERELRAQVPDRPLEQGGLSCARRAHEVQREDGARLEEGPVLPGDAVVLGQDGRLHPDATGVLAPFMAAAAMVIVVVVDVTRVRMMPIVAMRVMAIVGVRVVLRMCVVVLDAGATAKSAHVKAPPRLELKALDP